MNKPLNKAKSKKDRRSNLLVKVLINRCVAMHIQATRRIVKTHISRIRSKALKNLEEIFEAALKVAGER